MAIGEFDLINRYFVQSQPQIDRTVQLSIGDDCALISIPTKAQLAVTTDTMVEGTHFFPSIDPADLAYKAVATNLSDLAAMGAMPKWISLALTLPHIDEDWLAKFSQSLMAVLADYQVALIGGDTTKGPLSVTITAQGLVEQGQALCRHQAKVGDLIYVSGTLGDSAGGLHLLLNGKIPKAKSAVISDEDFLIQRHLRPTPRVTQGRALVDVANAAIDLSDGLYSDLGHILKRSQCAAEIELSALPLSSALLSIYGREQAERFALSGGEDYELCFTVPAEKQQALEHRLATLDVACHCIGRITSASQTMLKCGDFSPRFLRNGKPTEVHFSGGFDHFKEESYER